MNQNDDGIIMEPNETLIKQADIKKTGANVHAFNEAICNYRASIDVANGTAWWIKNSNDNIKRLGREKALMWEKYLQHFIITGNFDNSLKPRCYI